MNNINIAVITFFATTLFWSIILFGPETYRKRKKERLNKEKFLKEHGQEKANPDYRNKIRQ